MEHLIWPLSILSRCIHYRNLTHATEHVGLSQPQLSRLIQKIEEDLGVTLLDRTSKRRSTWTDTAYKLAEKYSQSHHHLVSSIEEVVKSDLPSELRVLTLEGLAPLAVKTCNHLLTNSELTKIELNVYDQAEIEKQFSNGDADLVFTFQIAGRATAALSKILGYQTLSKIGLADGTMVLSDFELATKYKGKTAKNKKYLLSNSLAVRRNWLAQFGGQGYTPSEVTLKKGADATPIKVFAKDTLNKRLWDLVKRFDAL